MSYYHINTAAMSLFRIILLYCVLHACLSDENVLELSDVDFDIRISDYETSLVMFYAPWCAHCQRLRPNFEKAAEELSKNHPPVTLFKIDCTKSGKSTCAKYNIDGYPTLKIFKNGKFLRNYEEAKNVDDIVEFMKTQIGPNSKELSIENLEEFLSGAKKVSLVGFFQNDSDLFKAFLNVAEKLRHKFNFRHFTKRIKDEVILYRPQHLHNKFEADNVTFAGTGSIEDIDNFIKKNYLSLVDHRKRDNVDDFKKPLICAYYNVDYVKNIKGTNYWRNRVLKVAKDYKEQINFAISNNLEFEYEFKEFGLDDIKNDQPIILARDEKMKKYVMKKPFSVEAFNQFVIDFLDGTKLTPYVKSEPLPISNDGPVTIVVGTNFQEIVFENEKDVLIELYAPWCGHCQKLAPVYDQLAEKMKNEAVEIAKMDATANDVPYNFSVGGFPTLYWLGKNSKDKPQLYKGGRELNDLITFIAKSATEELREYDREGNLKIVKVEL